MKKILSVLLIFLSFIYLTSCDINLNSNDDTEQDSGDGDDNGDGDDGDDGDDSGDETSLVPLIRNIAGGDLSDGSIIEISGVSFGVHNLDIEWLGGQNGNIEQGAAGGVFDKTDWSVDTISTSFQSSLYSDEKAHSHSKSIKSSWPIKSQYGSGFGYIHNDSFDSLYVSYWVYFDHVNSGGQWKMWRIRPNSGVRDTDGEIMSSNWHEVTGEKYQSYTMILCDKGDYSQCYPVDQTNHYNEAIPVNQWARVDLWFKGSSAAGVRDGSFKQTYDDQVNVTYTIREHNGNIITRVEGIEKWDRFTFQNYFGNNFEGYVNIKYSDDGGLTFTGNSGEDIGDYIGARSYITSKSSTDSLSVSAYTWTVRGINEGPQGDGVYLGEGPNDIDLYYWVKYADDENGTNINDNSGTYIGTCVSNSSDESTDADDYVWLLWEDAKSTTPLMVVDKSNTYLGAGTSEEVYFDDIYVQVNNRARVEMCNEDTYDVCTHREIQTPTSWSNGSIDITVNQGSFEDGDAVYLYVVNEDGAVNEEGYAVKFVKIEPDPPVEIIVDNQDIEFSTTGAWNESGAPNEYNDSSLYSNTNGDTATWSVEIEEPGAYEVYAWWGTAGTRATSAPYQINNSDGSDIVRVNQQEDGGAWNLLGAYNFDSGGSTVVLTREDDQSSTSADAVRFVKISN